MSISVSLNHGGPRAPKRCQSRAAGRLTFSASDFLLTIKRSRGAARQRERPHDVRRDTERYHRVPRHRLRRRHRARHDLEAHQAHRRRSASSFSPCGRRWREAPDERLLQRTQMQEDCSRRETAHPPSFARHPLPQGERGRRAHLRPRAPLPRRRDHLPPLLLDARPVVAGAKEMADRAGFDV